MWNGINSVNSCIAMVTSFTMLRKMAVKRRPILGVTEVEIASQYGKIDERENTRIVDQ